jgi:thiopeptide-type bacteriocin biosynthesis protein
VDGMPDRLRALLAPVLGGQVETFLAGGLAAVAADGGSGWVQLGLAARPGAQPNVLAVLDEVASALIADPSVTNFFFMRKTPGLRVRFETAPPRRRQLEADLYAHLARIRPQGGGQVVPGVYEPEEHLFGGPASMPFVHRVFTVDSLAWLAFYRLGAATPAWVFSLALLRHLLDGVGVVGWEDLDVWQRIGRQAGRTLPSGLTGVKVAAACAGIQSLWSDPARLRANLAGPVAALVDEWGPRLEAAGNDWRTGYFGTRGAVIGPREGMAFVTIFHWNRGGLSAARQSTLAAALADRGARP